ncbi:MAG: hypothetical protein ABUJ98_13810 [Hyphomicrobium sp.]
MTRARDHDIAGQRSPSGRIDAAPEGDCSPPKTRKARRSEPRTPSGRQPLTPKYRRLIAALNVALAKKGISHRKAGRLAGVDEGDTCRVLAFGEATPRTLRKLFEVFHVNEYKNLSAADRRAALLHEVHASAERTAELLGELAALAVGDPPEI